jgi:hypothetical protein
MLVLGALATQETLVDVPASLPAELGRSGNGEATERGLQFKIGFYIRCQHQQSGNSDLISGFNWQLASEDLLQLHISIVTCRVLRGVDTPPSVYAPVLRFLLS